MDRRQGTMGSGTGTSKRVRFGPKVPPRWSSLWPTREEGRKEKRFQDFGLGVLCFFWSIVADQRIFYLLIVFSATSSFGILNPRKILVGSRWSGVCRLRK